MYFIDLPVEMGALILSYLNTETKLKAYSVVELRKFFLASILRKFDLSRSTALVKTLNIDVFQHWAANIHDLNLSRIMNLTVPQLSPHIHRCVNLQTLDITFTSIYLSDLVDICPEKLKNISVNFFKWPRKVKGKDAWKKSIEHFQRQRFENVHFIVFGYDSDFPLLFMKDVPRTKSLKITVARNYNSDLWEYDNYDAPLNDVGNIIGVNSEKLHYDFRDYCIMYVNSRHYIMRITNLDYKQVEYILFMYLGKDEPTNLDPIPWFRPSEEIRIYVSPIFSSLFAMHCSDLKIEVSTHLPLNIKLGGKMVLKAWNKSFTEFNDAFFKTILKELKDYFPTYVCMHNKMEMTLTEAPSDWFCIDSCQGFERCLDRLPEKVTLTNYCRKEGRVMPTTDPVHLTQSNTLKNITFLRLSNICLSGDFFTTLFNQAKNLYTLDVYIEKREIQGSSLSLPNSMDLTKSLKNMRLTSADIDYETLFASLCQCPTLENVHISEYAPRTVMDAVNPLNMVSLIEKCVDLYSVFIVTDLYPENMTLLKRSMRTAAEILHRDLFIEVSECGVWHPFADVFNPSPLNIFG